MVDIERDAAQVYADAIQALRERKYSLADVTMVVNRSLWDFQRQPRGLTSFKGQRDYYTVLGYPEAGELDYDYYYKWYKRGGLAKRIVSLPAQDTWKRPPAVTEEGETETPFVQDWQSLVDRLGVWSVLTRADRLSGIYRYGVLVIGVAGDKRTSEPLEEGELDGPNDVLWLRPLSEAGAQIRSVVQDPQNPRFGLPETYTIDVSTVDAESSAIYHWTRIIHLAENRDNSEIFGTPRLETVINDLIDYLKLGGGTAEATWLNMRPGTVIKPEQGYKMTTSESDILDYIARYSHDPLRFLLMPYQGVDVSQIGTSDVPAAGDLIDKKLDAIAADTGIPKRVLMGSAAGQLASAQEDTRQWAGNIATRQKTYAEDEVLRMLIDRLIWTGGLTAPAQPYTVGMYNETSDMWEWPSIIDMTPLEQSDIVLRNAQARAALVNPSTGIKPSTTAEDRELLGLTPEPELTANLRVNQEEDDNPPDRGTFEDDIQETLRPVFVDFQQQAQQDIEQGRQPDYSALEAALLAALLLWLPQIARSRADEIQEQFMLQVDDAELDTAIARWAREYGEERARQLTETTRDLLRQAQQTADEEDRNAIIARAFGDARRENISITETTVAISAGLIALNVLYRTLYQVQADERWYTQADERVCPVCAPLHLKSRSVWESEFPNGPPAHPRCRCYTQVQRLRRVE